MGYATRLWSHDGDPVLIPIGPVGSDGLTPGSGGGSRWRCLWLCSGVSDLFGLYAALPRTGSIYGLARALASSDKRNEPGGHVRIRRCVCGRRRDPRTAPLKRGLAVAIFVLGISIQPGCNPAGLSPKPSATPAAWDRLEERPLRFASTGATATCPASSSTRVEDGGYALGSSPIYLRIDALSASTTVYFGNGQPDSLGRKLAKVMFRVGSSYNGPLLIRGQRIDATGGIGISLDGAPVNELQLTISHDTGPVETWPAYLAFRDSGCYGLQIDGISLTQHIYFSASSQSGP